MTTGDSHHNCSSIYYNKTTQTPICAVPVQQKLNMLSKSTIANAMQALSLRAPLGYFNDLLVLDEKHIYPISAHNTEQILAVNLLESSLLDYAFGAAREGQEDGLAVFNCRGNCLSCNHQFDELNDAQNIKSTTHDLITRAIDGRFQSMLTLNETQYRMEGTAIGPAHCLWAIKTTLIGNAADNTEALKFAKAKAEQANEAKSRFLATMSHEIRSPLNAIINMAELLLNTTLTTKQKQYAKVAHSGGQTLLALINDILDFSKIEAGHLKLNENAFDLVATIEDIAHLFWPRAHEKNIALCLSINPNLSGHFFGDEQRIRQILINLINNAIKFTEEGSVSIDLNEAKDYEGIEITICDTGIGMSPEESQSVFQAFVQAQSSHDHHSGGTGLGLAIVQQLTEIMDGSITVDSKLNKGSRFRLELPLQKVLSSDPAINLLPSLANTDRWLAIIDTKNEAIFDVLHQQNTHFGIQTLKLSDITEPILVGFESIFIFGDADEAGQNILRYHEFAEHYIQCNVIHFLALSNLNYSDSLRGQILRGFSATLDHPILPSFLRKIYFGGSQKQPQNHSEAPNTNTTILLVDDSEANRAVADALLEQIGVACDMAINGKEAVEMAQKKRYPLILMDLAMPIMDGLEATSHIRTGTSFNKETPIVALTANAFADDRAACLASGMNDYLSKPINSEVFYQKVQHWLHQDVAHKQVAAEQTAHKSKPSSDITENDDSRILDDRVLQQLIKDTSTNSLRIILDIYCKEVEERIPQMELLLSQEIWTTLADEAHILKSSSASFGAVELSARAKTIELGVRAGQYNQVREAMNNIAQLANATLRSQRKFISNLQR